MASKYRVIFVILLFSIAANCKCQSLHPYRIRYKAGFLTSSFANKHKEQPGDVLIHSAELYFIGIGSFIGMSCVGMSCERRIDHRFHLQAETAIGLQVYRYHFRTIDPMRYRRYSYIENMDLSGGLQISLSRNRTLRRLVYLLPSSGLAYIPNRLGIITPFGVRSGLAIGIEKGKGGLSQKVSRSIAYEFGLKADVSNRNRKSDEYALRFLGAYFAIRAN